MNILTEVLPSSVDINGITLEIETDFRAGISFELMIQKGEEDILKLLSPFFPKGIKKEYLREALQAVELFYCCGKLPEKSSGITTNKKQSYCFEQDANIIFADFLNFYGINLNTVSLHWWAFRSLLEGLPEKSEFKQRIYYRNCDTKGMSKKEKERIAKYKKFIEIKTSNKENKLTLEERNAQFKNYVKKRSLETRGGDIKNG